MLYEKKLFDVFSNGTNGYIDVENLKHLLFFLGYRVNAEQLKYLLESINIKHCKLSTDDVNQIRQTLDTLSLDDVRNAFSFLSNNDDLKFDMKILKRILLDGEDSFTQEELDELVHNIDCDHEGVFNYDVFINKKLTF